MVGCGGGEGGTMGGNNRYPFQPGLATIFFASTVTRVLIFCFFSFQTITQTFWSTVSVTELQKTFQ